MGWVGSRIQATVYPKIRSLAALNYHSFNTCSLIINGHLQAVLNLFSCLITNNLLKVIGIL